MVEVQQIKKLFSFEENVTHFIEGYGIEKMIADVGIEKVLDAVDIEKLEAAIEKRKKS